MSASAELLFQPGDRVAGYQLHELLGRGGMGEVWRADGPDGAVAIKLVAAEGDLERRFEREVKAVMALDHPNVVMARDHGRTADGAFYLAMELLEGESLEARLDRQTRIPFDDAIGIVSAAALALAAAHNHGIIHRDVKPGNVFLCADGSVRLLDFGLALLADTGSSSDKHSRITESGMLVGTPSYMAPEQATGAGDVDERSDVWALGALLYRSVAGRTPFFVRGNPVAELVRIATGGPDPLPKDIPADIVHLVMRALAKDPAQRFQTMQEMSAALETLAREGQGSISQRSVELVGEVRIVAALLVDVRDEQGLEAFSAQVEAQHGVAARLRDRRAVGVFGGKEWLGDEAERAVRAGLESLKHVEWAGVGLGQALCVGGVDNVTGSAIGAAVDALRAAAALPTTHAGGDRDAPGVLCVCDETQKHIRGGFELRGPRVVCERTGQRVIGVRQLAGIEVSMIGREDSLQRVTTAIERAATQRWAESVLVVGGPGMGKSRLVYGLEHWLVERAREYRFLEVRGESTGTDVSHSAIQEMIRRRAQVPEGTAPDDARGRIEALVSSASLSSQRARGTADFLGELLGVPFPDNRHLATARANPAVMADRIRIALADLFEGWCLQLPLVLLAEDAQWLDDASLGLVEFLLSRLADQRFAVVATARPQLLDERPDAFGRAERIELGELSDDDMARIVEQVLGREEPAIVARAAGNPSFAEELALAVREGAHVGSLPLTVEAAVRARLDALDSAERDALKRAAVFGRRFWTEAVLALRQSNAADMLGRLRRRDLILPTGESRLAGCQEWTFRHAVVQEVCLATLTTAQRCELHALAADWLAGRRDVRPEEVAEHLEGAERFSEAVLWWRRLVHKAEAAGDSAGVVGFTDRLFAATARASALALHEQYRLRCLRILAFDWLGRSDEAAGELRLLRQFEIADPGVADDAARASLRRAHALHLRRSGQLELALPIMRDGLTLADRSGDIPLRVQLRSGLATMLAMLARYDEAEAAVEDALTLARHGDAVARGLAERARGHVAAARGNPMVAMRACANARHAFIEGGDVRHAASVSNQLASCLLELGDADAAHDVLAEALAKARSLGMRPSIGWLSQTLGLALSRLGRHEEGMKAECEARNIAHEVGDLQLGSKAQSSLGVIALAAGAFEEALDHADATLALARLAPTASTAFLISRATRAIALLASGQPAEALAETERALARRARQGGMEQLEFDLLLTRHDALLALGREEEAAEAMDAAILCFDHRLEGIDDPRLSRLFCDASPSHSRLSQLAEERSLAATLRDD